LANSDSSADRYDPVERLLALGSVLLGSWVPLPAWARYFVQTGALSVGLRAEERKRLVQALVVPTRAYAAAFSALGVVLKRLSVPAPADPGAHLTMLSKLPKGTPVTYRTRETLASFAGLLVECTQGSVVIQVAKGSTIHIAATSAHFVLPSARSLDDLPEQASSRSARAPGTLAATLLGKDLAAGFRMSSRLEVVIVGPEAVLREEITSTQLRIRFEAELAAEGPLQELVRVRRFAADDGPHRANVFATAGSRQEEARGHCPAVAIFDGAVSLLKWGALWPSANRIVILDRADRHLVEATAEIDREHVANRAAGAVVPASVAAPDGVDAAAYEIVAG